MAFLGMVFVCCVLLVSGLPPLPGFLAKFALLSTVLQSAAATALRVSAWVLCAAIVLSGFVSVIALSRIGMRLFWSVAARTTPRLRLLEAAPVAALVLLCLGLAVAADPVMRYLEHAAHSLHQPDTYIRAVLSQETAASSRSSRSHETDRRTRLARPGARAHGDVAAAEPDARARAHRCSASLLALALAWSARRCGRCRRACSVWMSHWL